MVCCSPTAAGVLQQSAAWGGGELPTSHREVASYFPPRDAMRSTMTASAPSPVTLQAVPKLSMAM